jgi:hypothetical protein
MQILLACAKIMNESTAVKTPSVSQPVFRSEAEHFALLMSQRTVDELMDMLHCSRQLAVEAKERYNSFFDNDKNIPAILAYYGQAYKCLNAQTLEEDDFCFAQQHLWITSFLYGILRPLDLIHPYRMEGKVELMGQCGNVKDSQGKGEEGETTENNCRLETGYKTMFQHWKPLLTDLLIDAVKADDGVLVHLATEEMQHLFDWRRIFKEVDVVQPQFLVEKNGKLKSVTVYAKSCRGAMTRFIIRNRLDSPSSLQGFEYEGFSFRAEYGDASHPHFILD